MKFSSQEYVSAILKLELLDDKKWKECQKVERYYQQQGKKIPLIHIIKKKNFLTENDWRKVQDYLLFHAKQNEKEKFFKENKPVIEHALGDALKQEMQDLKLSECKSLEDNKRETGKSDTLGDALKQEMQDLKLSEFPPQSTTKDSEISIVSPQIQESKNFSRYQLDSLLGEGAMGAVYKAYDPELQREVALKIIKGSFLSQKQQQRFQREAQLLARLDHPNIVRIFDMGFVQNQQFFTMEIVHGCTLDEIIAECQIVQLIHVMIKVSKAIHFAHQEGIIHRDLKPSNIMLDQHMEPKVMDFGLAKKIDDNQLSKTEGVVGTPLYMSPEQVNGASREIDTRSDVYALGVILYEILVGKPPFLGEKNNLYHEILFEEPLSPRKWKKNISRDIEAVCLKCLEKDKNKRYPSAKVLAEDLERFISGEPVTAKPYTFVARSQKWLKRHPVILTLLIVSIMGIFSYGLYSFYQITIERDYYRLQSMEQRINQRELSFQLLEKERNKIISDIASWISLNAAIESKLILAKNYIDNQQYFLAQKSMSQMPDFLSESNALILAIEKAWIETDKQQIQQITREHLTTKYEQNAPYVKKLNEMLDNQQQRESSAVSAFAKSLQKFSETFSDFFTPETKTTKTQWLSVLRTLQQTWGNAKLHFEMASSSNFYTKKLDQREREIASVQASWKWRALLKENNTIVSNRHNKEEISFAISAAIVAFSSDDSLVAMGSYDGEVILYNFSSNKSWKKRVFPREVEHIKFSPDNKWLFASDEKNPILMRIDQDRIFEIPYKVEIGSFSNNSQYLAISDFDSYVTRGILIFDLNQVETSLPNPKKKISARASCLAFGHDDKYIIAGYEGTVSIYSLKNEEQSRIPDAHVGKVYAVAASLDGEFIASVGQDSRLVIRNGTTYEVILDMEVSGFLEYGVALAFQPDPDENSLGFWTPTEQTYLKWQEKIKHWQIITLTEATHKLETINLMVDNRTQRFVSVDISPDEEYLAYFFFPDFYMWDLQQQKIIWHQKDLNFAPNFVQFHPTKNLVLGREKELLKIWEVSSGQLWFYNNKRDIIKKSMFVSSEYDFLTYNRTSNFNIDLNKLIAPHKIKTIKSLALQENSTIHHIDISPDREKLLISRNHSLTEVWDIKSEPRNIFRKVLLNDQEKRVRDLEPVHFFSPTKAVFANETGEVFVYDFTKETFIVRLFLASRIHQLFSVPEKNILFVHSTKGLFLLPIFDDPAVAKRVEQIYPLPLFANYRILAMTFDKDCHNVYLVFKSYIVKFPMKIK